ILACDERRSPGRAALLPVIVCERQALITNSIDIGGAIAHLATVVVAEVPPTDVVTPKDQNIGFFGLRHCTLPYEKFVPRRPSNRRTPPSLAEWPDLKLHVQDRCDADREEKQGRHQSQRH